MQLIVNNRRTTIKEIAYDVGISFIVLGIKQHTVKIVSK